MSIGGNAQATKKEALNFINETKSEFSFNMFLQAPCPRFCWVTSLPGSQMEVTKAFFQADTPSPAGYADFPPRISSLKSK